MKNSTKLVVMAILSLPALLSASPRHATTVHLKVILDGRQVAAPSVIKVRFGGHSLRLPVREGKFEAPPELLAAKSVTLETDVTDSHVRLTQIAGFNFAGKWTLRLAEHFNVNYYDWPGPKGADIPSSCMLEFDTGHEEPLRGHFEQNCRSKRK